MVTNRILDYDELNECLDILDNIKEEEPIGTTRFGYPIRHFTFGKGENHVIMTAGTHATELISNHYLIHVMEELNKSADLLDQNKYTIHFIPILNPEGTIVTTSAIRAKLKRGCSLKEEQDFCKRWYTCCKLDDETGSVIKRKYEMFQKVDANCIEEKHKALREHIKHLTETYRLPQGSIIQWTANGNGINLNDNSPSNVYLDKKRRGIPRYLNDDPNGLNLSVPNPMGTICVQDEFCFEKENEALLELYQSVATNGNLIGSIIYHSCGGLVRYLEDLKELNNPWRTDITKAEYRYNTNVASAYSTAASYRMIKTKAYNTVSSKLESTYPGTILVELGKIRGNPFGQFINDNGMFDEMLTMNDKALIRCIETMYQEFQKFESLKGKTLK